MNEEQSQVSNVVVVESEVDIELLISYVGERLALSNKSFAN